MGNFKRLGVPSQPLDGRDRLAVLHGQMHPHSREQFSFSWKELESGMGTKDYIAPESFDFRQSRTFRIGQMWGAASFLQILASEMSDKLAGRDFWSLTPNDRHHAHSDGGSAQGHKDDQGQTERHRAHEGGVNRKRRSRSGYDMDILPPDLVTFSKDAADLLADLQSRNERMFLLTFTVVNIAPSRQKLENDVFTVGGYRAAKYNCALEAAGLAAGAGALCPRWCWDITASRYSEV